MSELLLVETFREAFADAWSMLQWWASVSFGLIAVASFARDKLNLVVVMGLSVLYSLFTAYSYLNIAALATIALGARVELAALSDSGSISAVGLSVLEYWERLGHLNARIFPLCFLITFVGTLAYLWYAFRNNSKAV